MPRYSFPSRLEEVSGLTSREFRRGFVAVRAMGAVEAMGRLDMNESSGCAASNLPGIGE